MAVINSTEQSGLAGQYSEIAQNIGVRVIRVDSEDQEVEYSQFYLNPEKENNPCRLAVERLKLFSGQVITEETEQTQRYRADLVLIFGEDLAQFRQDEGGEESDS